MPREGSGVPFVLLLPRLVSAGAGTGVGRHLPSLIQAVLTGPPPSAFLEETQLKPVLWAEAGLPGRPVGLSWAEQ